MRSPLFVQNTKLILFPERLDRFPNDRHLTFSMILRNILHLIFLRFPQQNTKHS